MQATEERTFLKTIEQFYAAALGNIEWQHVLNSAAKLFAADNAYVSRIEHDQRSLDYVVLRPLDWNAVSVDRYAELMNDDPRIAGFRGNAGRAVQCRSLISEAQLHASRIYKEALRPLDIEYTMLVGLPEPGGVVTNYLGLTRGLLGEPFERSDCALFNELIPHFSNALAIHNIVSDARRQRLALDDLLDRLPFPAFVADRVAHVRHMNAAAGILSEPGRVLRVSNGRLLLHAGEDQDRLLKALHIATDPVLASRRSQTFVVNSYDAGAALTLSVDPLDKATAGLFPGEGGQLAFISVRSAGPHGDTDKDRLRSRFGLSPAQARLALMVGDGMSIREMAKVLGITEGSARQYLKIVFNKTGAKRQGDLVRLVVNALANPPNTME